MHATRAITYRPVNDITAPLHKTQGNLGTRFIESCLCMRLEKACDWADTVCRCGPGARPLPRAPAPSQAFVITSKDIFRPLGLKWYGTCIPGAADGFSK